MGDAVFIPYENGSAGVHSEKIAMECMNQDLRPVLQLTVLTA